MSAITYLEVCLPNHRTVGEIVFMGKPEFVFRNTCALPRFQTRRCVLQAPHAILRQLQDPQPKILPFPGRTWPRTGEEALPSRFREPRVTGK